MVEARWLRGIGPGVAALGAVALVATTTFGVGARPWPQRTCEGPPAERVAAARDPGRTTVAAIRGAPWYRLDPVLDRDGALAGQRLVMGLAGDPVPRVVDLPAESFAAGPFGRVILAGSDDGTTSRLQALDVAAGCAWPLDAERNVIRRATLDASGTRLFEMRVDRATRADLGIWLWPIDGHGPVRQVLPAPPPDPRFGRTWSTEFSWDVSADRLAVQSCGDVACRTRIIDRDGRPIATLDAPDLGPLVGFDGDRVVTYGACRGLPCPIVATDLGTGQRRLLARAAGPAVVVATPDGARLVHEAPLAAGRGLRAVALDGAGPADLGPLPDGLGLLAAPDRTDAIPVPTGWVLLAPGGRLPGDGHVGDARFRRIPDGTTLTLDEATR